MVRIPIKANMPQITYRNFFISLNFNFSYYLFRTVCFLSQILNELYAPAIETLQIGLLDSRSAKVLLLFGTTHFWAKKEYNQSKNFIIHLKFYRSHYA